MKKLALFYLLMFICTRGNTQGCDVTPSDGLTGPITVEVENFNIGELINNGSNCNLEFTMDYKVNNPSNCSIWNLAGIVICGTGGSATTFNLMNNGQFNTISAAISNVDCEAVCAFYISGGWGGSCASASIAWPGTECGQLDLGAPMPVELVNFEFDLNYKDKGVKLNWETASEINNDYFEILMSENGRDFAAMDRVYSNEGNTDGAKYSYSHLNAPRQSIYYKLKQVDYSGSVSFSEIIFRSALPNTSWNIYPNPSRGAFQISAPNQISNIDVLTYELSSMTGATVKQGTFKSNEIIEHSDLLKGIYILQWTYKGERFARRIVVK